jgi:hypothetical protein
MTERCVLNWFKLKCPYPVNSQIYKDALRGLDGSSYNDRERLSAEFEAFENPIQLPVEHYSIDGKNWIATLNGIPPAQQNLKGIHQHGKKWRVERRIDGELFRWTFDTRKAAVEKRDKVFSGVWSHATAQQDSHDRLTESH